MGNVTINDKATGDWFKGLLESRQTEQSLKTGK
jgi:hypothetical protein